MEKDVMCAEELRLLDDFNSRLPVAYEQIYLQLCKSLNIFAATLYGCLTHESQDMVEDAFVNLWLSENKFESYRNLNAYLYVAVKNNYITYTRKNNSSNKFRLTLQEDDFTENIIEAEIYSLVDEVVGVLPVTYGEVIRKYIEGYKPAEIAQLLGKTEQSIYKIKNKSLTILRQRLTKDKFFSILPLI